MSSSLSSSAAAAETAAASSSSSLSSSPIRVNNIHPFVALTRPESERPIDYYSLLSLLFGALAVATHLRFYAWLTLLMFLACIANIRYSEMDIRQTVASFSLVILTFISLYFKPAGPFFLPRRTQKN